MKMTYKTAANAILNQAISDGIVTRQPCGVCGSPDAHAHHEDYYKPLEVVWLCPRHHNHRHRELRVGGGPLPELPVTQRAVDKVLENRMRRALERRGYTLVKMRRRDPHTLDHGKYIIVPHDGRTLGIELQSLADVQRWVDEP